MRIIRIWYSGRALYAALDGENALPLIPQPGIPEALPLASVCVLPVAAPTKIICVDLNYRSHAEELNKRPPLWPSFFLKPPSAIIASGQAIEVSPDAGSVDFEGELALIVGRAARRVGPDEARQHIFGYTCANDVTARDMQSQDPMLGRCKGYDTFCPVGPWLETDVPDPTALPIETLINGQMRQQGHTSDMIFSPPELLASISQVMTLHPGDVILTGTPAGVGSIKPGDEVQVRIAGVGTLINPVEATFAGAQTECRHIQ